MPWKNSPELWQIILGIAATALSVSVGSMAKIAEEVKRGYRHKFFTKQLWLDVPALWVMIVLAWGIIEYYDLSGGAAAAVGAVFGYLGPRIMDAIVAYKFDWPDNTYGPDEDDSKDDKK